MKRYIRIIFAMTVLVTIISILSGCKGFASPFETEDPAAVLTYTVTDSSFDLTELDKYPNLHSVDLQGYPNMDAIIKFASEHPGIHVIYNVTIGTESYNNEVKTLTLDAKALSYTDLLANLKYLPHVTTVLLPETTLTPEQIQTLQETYPNVRFEYTLMFQGELCTLQTTDLNLSRMTPDQIEETVSVLQLLPNLQNIELMSADGTSLLGLTDVKKLQEALPQVFFHYSFDLFGKTVSTSDETIEYDEVYIGNEGEEQIRQALDILTNLTYFKADTCGIDNEVMDSIRQDYPDVKVVWRVFIEPFSMLTDETMLRLTFHMDDSNVENLKYFHDVTYLDMGHNEPLTDVSFIQYMPKLECVILSGSSVTDISAFANCKELVWLELCFCSFVEDLSPIADLPNLKYLNVSFSRVSNLAPLENLPLERFNCMQTMVDWENENNFKQWHPDCISVFEGVQPYGYGWRYNDYGYTFFEYYANMRIVFRYDEADYFGNHKEH